MNVPGRGMNFPITLSYAAGIKVGEEASWVGLGWDFFPGSITRNVNGIPDDYKAGDKKEDGNVGLVIADWGLFAEGGISLKDVTKTEDVKNKNLINKITGFFAKITGNVVKNSGNKITGMGAWSWNDYKNKFIGVDNEDYNPNLVLSAYEQSLVDYCGTEIQTENELTACGMERSLSLAPQSGYGGPGSDIELYNVDIPAGQMGQIISGMVGDQCSTTFSTNGFMYFNPKENINDDRCSSSNEKIYMDRMNPDSFSISGPISGNMMFIDDDGKFHMKSFSGEYNKNRDDQIKIDYKTDADGTIKSFTITAKDGTRYIYDYPVYNVNQNGYSTFEDETVKNLMPTPPIWQLDFKFKRRGATENTELFDYVSKAQTRGSDTTLFQRYFFRKFAYTWLLTKILAPNYEDKTGDGPTSDDKGNWIKFNYEKVYDENTKPYEYRTPFNSKDENFNFGTQTCSEYFTYGSGCSQSSNTGYMEIAYLTSIVTPTHTAEFTTSFRNDGAEYIADESKNYKSGRTLKKLDEIQLKKDGNLISKVKFDYDYYLNRNIPNNIKTGKWEKKDGESYEGSGGKDYYESGRLTLNKIQQFDKGNNSLPITSFMYEENPDWDQEFEAFVTCRETCSGCSNCVQTGKCTGKCDGCEGCIDDQEVSTYKDVTDNHFDDFGYYWVGGTQGNHKILDGRHYVHNPQARVYNPTGMEPTGQGTTYYNDARAWSLAGVKWPSGSSIWFEYETKKYGQVGDMKTKATANIIDPDGVYWEHCKQSTSSEYGSRGFYGSCPLEEHYGGGIRVKSITQLGSIDYKSDYRYTTKYEYEDGIKTYGEPIISQGRYFVSVKSEFNPRFVGYGKVTEKITKNIQDEGQPYGKIVHEFTTRNDYPPIEITDVPKTLVGGTYSYNFEDKSALHGLEKKTTYYDNEDNIIRTIENKYDFNENGQLKWQDWCKQDEVNVIIGLESCRRGPDRGRGEVVKSYWIKLKETKDTLDGVEKTINYEYNDVNGLPSKTTESGNDVTKISEVDYAFDKYPGMLDKHIITKPYETSLKDSNNNLISKSKTEYWSPGIFNLYNKEFFYYPVKSASMWKNTDNKELTTTFNKYDEYGNLLETTDSKGYKTYFEYSPIYDYAYLTKGENALGQFMLTDYDPAFGVVKSITDFNGQTTYYDYDNFGRLIKVIKDGKVLNQYEYDDKSFDWRKTKTRIDVLKEINLIEYFDDFARLDKTELIGPVGNIVTRTEYNLYLIDKVSKVYKPDYNKTSSLFTFSEYEYDPLARVAIVDPPGEGDIKTSYSNQEGMYKTSVIDEEGRVKSSLTDVYGNLIKIIEPGTLQTKYTYDIQNNLLTITDSKNRKVTDNKYNSLGQLIESWQADTGTTKFVYDDNGNMVERNQNGITTTYSYDKLNRLIKITYPTTAVVNIYDSNCLNNAYVIGKLCQIQDISGMIQFEYDSWGRVVKEIKNVKNDNLGINKKYTITYTYNDINDITEINLFNENNELINKIDYEYNNLNQLEKVKVNDKEITYSYNPTSTIKEISFGNNIKTSYDYTERDWIKGINTGNIFNRDYSYDKIGNLKELKKNNLLLATFSYDVLDRLTKVADNNYYKGNIEFTYDSVGNRLTRNGINYNYMPNNNQMVSDGNCSYAYNVNGNTKTKTCSGITTNYNYDEENRLIKVILPDGKVNEDVYDANGLRTIKKDSAGTTIYIYDMNGNNIYEETI